MFGNTIGTPFGGWFGKPAYAVVVVNFGNQLAVVGAVALLPVPKKRGCVNPGVDGGTGAAATAGPTSGPFGTTPIGGGVGGGKFGTATGLPIVGGGMIGCPVMLIGVAGLVALPLSKTGCFTPGMDGGTGAGSMGAPGSAGSESVTVEAT